MKVLCLLASLCLPSLILSDFKEMSMMCNHDETKLCNDTDSCKWNVSLDTCLTLQIVCKERTKQSSFETLCNSPVECGLENTGKFLEKLMGNISCEQKNGLTSCKLLLSCNQTIFLCENKDCDLHPILTGNNNKECTFYHSITQCIKKSGKFQKGINCTMTHSVAMSSQHVSCEPTGGNLTIGTTCPSADPYCIATIVLGCLVPVIIFVFLACIYLKRCHNNQEATRQTTPQTTPSESTVTYSRKSKDVQLLETNTSTDDPNVAQNTGKRQQTDKEYNEVPQVDNS